MGTSPAWLCPGNQISEIFDESMRGARLQELSTAVAVEDGNGAELIEAFPHRAKGIGDISRFSLTQ